MSNAADTEYVLEIDDVRIRVARKRVKNVNFRIGPDGTARMSVPWHVSRDRAEQIARSHIDWFRIHAQRATERRGLAPVAWESGDELRVWGKTVRLRVEETVDIPSCSYEGDELVLRVPAGTTSAGRAAFVEQWLKEELRAHLQELVPACEARVGAHATSVTLRRMKTRWGSCTASTGRIRLNVALAQCPPDCLEMVLVHELCHLLEANHGPRFHALMDLHYPSWRVAQRWLNEHPPGV